MPMLLLLPLPEPRASLISWRSASRCLAAETLSCRSLSSCRSLRWREAVASLILASESSCERRPLLARLTSCLNSCASILCISAEASTLRLASHSLTSSDARARLACSASNRNRSASSKRALCSTNSLCNRRNSSWSWSSSSLTGRSAGGGGCGGGGGGGSGGGNSGEGGDGGRLRGRLVSASPQRCKMIWLPSRTWQ